MYQVGNGIPHAKRLISCAPVSTPVSELDRPRQLSASKESRLDSPMAVQVQNASSERRGKKGGDGGRRTTRESSGGDSSGPLILDPVECCWIGNRKPPTALYAQQEGLFVDRSRIGLNLANLANASQSVPTSSPVADSVARLISTW
jgi:hypothetical protein